METLTPQDLIDPSLRFSVAAHRAARQLARTKPWQGTRAEREAKITACFDALRAAYASRLGDFADLTLRFEGPTTGCSGRSRFDARSHAIVLTGRLSVVTLLQLFAYALGMNQERAQRWAATLFARRFPISFARCRLVGGLLVNDGRIDG